MDYVFGPKVLNNLSKCIEYVNERNVCMCVYVMLRYTIKYVEEIFSCLVIPPSLQDITSLTRDWTWAHGNGSPSPNHWATREFPRWDTFWTVAYLKRYTHTLTHTYIYNQGFDKWWDFIINHPTFSNHSFTLCSAPTLLWAVRVWCSLRQRGRLSSWSLCSRQSRDTANK